MPATCPPAVPSITSEERGYLRNDHAPGSARMFVRAQLESWGLDRLTSSAELVVSELVTNSVQNAPGDEVAVRLEMSGGALVIRVWDDSPDMPAQRAVTANADSGRGLAIVDALSLEWSAYRVAGGGKVTWATIADGGM